MQTGHKTNSSLSQKRDTISGGIQIVSFCPHPITHTADPHLHCSHSYTHTHTHLFSLVIMTHLLSDTSYQFHHGSYTFVFTIPEVTAEVDGCCNRCKSTWHRTASASEISSELSWPGSRETMINNTVSLCIQRLWKVFRRSSVVHHLLLCSCTLKSFIHFFPLIRLTLTTPS